MLKTEFIVKSIGEPSLDALTDTEKQAFLEAILDRILELHQATM